MKTACIVFAVLSVAITSLTQAAVKSVVLVHGAFADGSGWKPVTDILERDGYSVYIVQEPETTFDADLAATRAVPDRSGPCVLVGHSYGRLIISEVGSHPSVRSLVFVAAFEPEVGETDGELQNKIPPASNSVVPLGNGFVHVKPEAFARDFAADSLMSEPSPPSSATWVTSTTSLITSQRSRASLSFVVSGSLRADRPTLLLRRVWALADDFEPDFLGLAFRGGGLMMAAPAGLRRSSPSAASVC